MTAAARITQPDMERAFKAMRSAGYEHGRVVMDLANQRIEVIIGAMANEPINAEEWSDEDV